MSINDSAIQSNFFNQILRDLRSKKHWNEKLVESFFSHNKSLITAFYGFIKRDKDPMYVDKGLELPRDDNRDEKRNKL